MKRSSLILLSAIVVAGLMAGPAMACGEAMYRMGGALRYQASVTHHPAQILVYSSPAAREQAQREHSDLVDRLAQAGHKITLVQTPQELERALSSHPWDVVITRGGDLPMVSDQVARAARTPAMIPVLDRNDDTVRQQYPLAQVGRVSSNRMLRTIERTMKERGS